LILLLFKYAYIKKGQQLPFLVAAKVKFITLKKAGITMGKVTS